MALAGELLHARGTHVVIRKGQAVSGDEGPGASVVEANRREANVIQPSLSEFKAVLGLDLVLRRLVVEPHAFVGQGEGRGKDKNRKQKGG